jgi:hypothetical protein
MRWLKTSDEDMHVEYPFKTSLFYKGHDTVKEFFIDILVEKEIVILRRRQAPGAPGPTFILSEIG